MEKRLRLEKYFKEMNMTFSLRVSIKIFRDGNIDSQRYTYCMGKLPDQIITMIMEFTDASKEAIEYIIRRNNDSTNFIMSVDRESYKFYLDSGFKPGKISMISIETKNDFLKVRNYTPIRFDLSLLHPIFHCFLPYMSNKMMLKRSDGQNYIRMKQEPIPLNVYQNFCCDNQFMTFVKESGNCPVWFQFSSDSFTLYFRKN